MSNWQQIDLSDNSAVGDPGPLPAALKGLAQSTLDDLSPMASSVPAYDGMGFWPVIDQPTPTETSRKRVGDTPSLSIDTDAKVVTRSWSLVDRDLAERKAEMRVEATAKFGVERDKGTTVGGALISTTHAAVLEISQALELINSTDPTGTINVVTRANVLLTLTASNTPAILTAMRAHVKACQEREHAIHTAINDAVDHDDLDDINISTGWPT
jgi:hypothetical protein